MRHGRSATPPRRCSPCCATFGLGLWRHRAATEELRRRYAGALLLGLAGLALTAAGAGMLIPAAPEYSVLGAGYENRINAFAGYGIALLLVAAAVIAGVLVTEALRGRRPARVVVPAVAAVALLPIGIGWLDDSEIRWATGAPRRTCSARR